MGIEFSGKLSKHITQIEFNSLKTFFNSNSYDFIMSENDIKIWTKENNTNYESVLISFNNDNGYICFSNTTQEEQEYLIREITVILNEHNIDVKFEEE